MSAPQPPAPPAPPALPAAGAAKTYAQKQAEAEQKKMDDYSALPNFASDASHKLTDEEAYILERKGTEAAGTGKYDKFYPKMGYFACRKCGSPIYSAAAKFDSGCGWPAFDKCYEGAIAHKVEDDGTDRIEITCASCGGHLGHIFKGEGFTQTNERRKCSASFCPGCDTVTSPLHIIKLSVATSAQCPLTRISRAGYP